MKRIVIALAVVVLTLPLLVQAQQQATGFLDRVVTVGSETYRYQVYVPADYSADRLWPVILFLHGAGERGADGLLQTDVGIGTAIRKHSARFPAIVVLPQARSDHRWDDAMQAQAVAALEAATMEFHGDRDRTYLTGLSMGGRGAWILAGKAPERFAALVVIAGPVTYIPETWTTIEKETAFREGDFLRSADPYGAVAAKVKSLPIRLFHGSADMAVPVTESRQMAAALQRLGTDVKYTEYEGLPHNSWDRAYAELDLIPWLLAQRRQTKGINGDSRRCCPTSAWSHRVNRLCHPVAAARGSSRALAGAVTLLSGPHQCRNNTRPHTHCGIDIATRHWSSMSRLRRRMARRDGIPDTLFPCNVLRARRKRIDRHHAPIPRASQLRGRGVSLLQQDWPPRTRDRGQLCLCELFEQDGQARSKMTADRRWGSDVAAMPAPVEACRACHG